MCVFMHCVYVVCIWVCIVCMCEYSICAYVCMCVCVCVCVCVCMCSDVSRGGHRLAYALPKNPGLCPTYVSVKSRYCNGAVIDFHKAVTVIKKQLSKLCKLQIRIFIINDVLIVQG